MAKAVLISIRPEWVKKILAGEKTLEVRKNRPNTETPFKVYIYCTNQKNIMLWNARSYIYVDDHNHNAFDRCWNGSVVGEFVCDEITWLTHIGFSALPGIRLAAMKNGYTIDDSFDFSKSCLTTPQQRLNARIAYAAAIERWAKNQPSRIRFFAVRRWLKEMPRKEDFYEAD